MKLANLKSLGHNMADSLASGVGLLIGVYSMDVFGEALKGHAGHINVDFLKATTSGSPVSAELHGAIKLYREALPQLCQKHRVSLEEIEILEARYGTDEVYGPHFAVTVGSRDGRRSTDKYVGIPGKRVGKRRAQ